MEIRKIYDPEGTSKVSFPATGNGGEGFRSALVFVLEETISTQKFINAFKIIREAEVTDDPVYGRAYVLPARVVMEDQQ